MHIIDDHADILGLTVLAQPAPLSYRLGSLFTSSRSTLASSPTVDGNISTNAALGSTTALRSCFERFATRWQSALSRFWRLDDDGSYLIAYNSTRHSEFPLEPGAAELGLMIVLTISPRRDHSDFDDDLQEVRSIHVLRVA